MTTFEPDTGLVVNTGTGTVHKPDCATLIPGSPWTSAWKGVAISGGDKACRTCKPDLDAARAKAARTAECDAPSTWRKKPVEIQAMQVLDDVQSHIAILKWAAASVREGDESPVSITALGLRMVIHTLEGDMRADIGDWIIRGVQGEFYPCKPDIFEATYERVAPPGLGNPT